MIPPCLRKTVGYCVEWTTPKGAFAVGASFVAVGVAKRLVLIGSKTLNVFNSAFLRRNSSASLTN